MMIGLFYLAVLASVPLAAGRLGALAQRRVEIGERPHAPARRVGAAAVGAHRVDLGRRAVLVALGERVPLGVDRRVRLDLEATPRPARAVAGHDRLQPRQGVDPDLRHQAPR